MPQLCGADVMNRWLCVCPYMLYYMLDKGPGAFSCLTSCSVPLKWMIACYYPHPLFYVSRYSIDTCLSTHNINNNNNSNDKTQTYWIFICVNQIQTRIWVTQCVDSEATLPLKTKLKWGCIAPPAEIFTTKIKSAHLFWYTICPKENSRDHQFLSHDLVSC